MVYALTINPTSFPAARIATIGTLLNVIIPLITIGASLMFLFMMIRAAFTWLTSGGKPENLAKAQKMFIWAIVGFVVVLAAFALTKLIGMIFNVNTYI